MDMQFQDIADYVRVAKETLDLFKAAYALLPAGDKKAEIESRIRRADQLIKQSDAKLAKDLGFSLCQCEWPPRIMLWKEDIKARVCPNADCNKQEKRTIPMPFAGGITSE
jgi:hypothetical protein